MFIRSYMVQMYSEHSTMNEDYILNLTFSETYLSASDCLWYSLIDDMFYCSGMVLSQVKAIFSVFFCNVLRRSP
jgi:ATP-dependent protease ClpP protease subunit